MTTLRGLRVTVPLRTILDIAARSSPRELEQALAIAEREGMVRGADLLAAVTRTSRRAGAPLLRTLLAAENGPAFTRSEAEERFLTLLRRAQVPALRTNAWIGKHQVDFFWAHERVVVEVDGRAWHTSRPKFEGDRRRDADLAAGGIQVMRVTWHQLTAEPEAVLFRLAQVLAVRRGGGRQDGSGDIGRTAV